MEENKQRSRTPQSTKHRREEMLKIKRITAISSEKENILTYDT